MIHLFEESAIRLKNCWRMVFLWFGLLGCSLYGQQLYFDQFSVSEGLAQSTIFQIIQDRDDIYWMGTVAGVSRFDGVEFTNFSAENGLADNGIRSVCQDRRGTIWFGHSGGGVTRYRNLEFEVLTGRDEFTDADITSILEDTAGHLWFTTEGSGVIEMINPEAEMGDIRLNHYSGRELSDRVFGSHMDPSGKIYFITDINEKYYNRDSSRFDNLRLNGIPQYYITTCILVDRKGNTWFGKYNGGLYRYDPVTDSAQMFDLVEEGLSSNWVTTLFEDDRGNIWAGTWEGGLARIDPENNVSLYNERNGLMGTKIWSIIQDREGNILIGTHENGLCVYKGDHFISYFEDDGLINSQVLAVMESGNGEMWFGTNKGISVMNRSTEGDRLRDYPYLMNERIGFLKEDGMGTIWIGTLDNGVFSSDRSGTQSYNRMINDNIYQRQITSMEVDHDNNLWIGTFEGLIYYEIEQQRVTRLSQEDGLKNNDISSVFADSKDRIWIGADGNGVTVIDGSDFIQLEMEFDFTPLCFTEDRDGTIWIGSRGKGLIQYDPDSFRIIQTYTVEQGLLANVINQLSCDWSNNIYIGSNKGLNIYFREEGIYSYTSSSGFVGIETKPNGSLVDSNGEVWFGTVQGVTRYRHGDEAVPRQEPLTHITGFQVNHADHAMETGLNLSYKQNSINVDYRCITLNPDDVQYKIKLDGLDMDWREATSQTTATYPALRHGKYTFMVLAKSSAGVWNSDPVSFQFTIKPPFYLTWWFILACILAAGLVIFMYIKIRERALKRENAILEEKVRDRTATVVAQKEELAQKNKDITDSIRYAKRIQFAILPEKSPFPDTFILFKPKDIVSGDFYWFTEVGDKELFSAVDCTGHGVPGAFMSIIGHNSLTKIVHEYGIIEPGKILTQLNKEVVETLAQRSDSGDVYDGMDLALVSYDKNKKFLEYSGAFNPLYLVRGKEILETKADKVSIGRSSINREVVFSNHRVKLNPGDTIYLFSDGYADQFGGELMKKFKYKKLKELILRIQSETMESQRSILDQTIEEWRGDVEQIDDILVIGRKF